MDRWTRVAHEIWQVRLADEADPHNGFSVVRAREERDFSVQAEDVNLDPVLRDDTGYHPAGEPIDDTHAPQEVSEGQRIAFVRRGQVEEGVVLVVSPDGSPTVQPDAGGPPEQLDAAQIVAPADSTDAKLNAPHLPAVSLQQIVDEMRRIVGMHKSAADFNQDFRPGAIIEAKQAFDPVLMSGTQVTIPQGAMLRVDGLHGPNADAAYAPDKLPLAQPTNPGSFLNSRIRVRSIDPRFGAGEIVPGYEYILLTPQEFTANFEAMAPVRAPQKQTTRAPSKPQGGDVTRVDRAPVAPDRAPTTPDRPIIERFGPNDQLYSADDDYVSGTGPTLVPRATP